MTGKFFDDRNESLLHSSQKMRATHVSSYARMQVFGDSRITGRTRFKGNCNMGGTQRWYFFAYFVCLVVIDS
jgi:hypothetical protein